MGRLGSGRRFAKKEALWAADCLRIDVLDERPRTIGLHGQERHGDSVRRGVVATADTTAGAGTGGRTGVAARGSGGLPSGRGQAARPVARAGALVRRVIRHRRGRRRGRARLGHGMCGPGRRRRESANHPPGAMSATSTAAGARGSRMRSSRFPRGRAAASMAWARRQSRFPALRPGLRGQTRGRSQTRDGSGRGTRGIVSATVPPVAGFRRPRPPTRQRRATIERRHRSARHPVMTATGPGRCRAEAGLCAAARDCRRSPAPRALGRGDRVLGPGMAGGPGWQPGTGLSATFHGR